MQLHCSPLMIVANAMCTVTSFQLQQQIAKVALTFSYGATHAKSTNISFERLNTTICADSV